MTERADTTGNSAGFRASATEELFARALASHQSGKIAEAKDLYLELRLRDPQHYDTAYLLGIAHYQCGQMAEALQELSAAISIDPDNPLAHLATGSALRSLNRQTEALQSYDRAITLAPQLPEAHNNRGNTLRSLGRLEEAVQSYDRAVALNPQYADAHNNRGIALSDAGNYLDALASYDTAIQIQAGNARFHLNKGTVLRSLNRAQEALYEFNQALSLEPDNANILNAKAATLSDLGEIDEALACYTAAIFHTPTHVHARYNRGLLLHKLGRIDEARSDFEDVLHLDPHFDYLEGLALHTSMKLCDWADIDEKRDHLCQGIRAKQKVSPPFPLLGLVDDPELHYTCARIYSEDKHPAISPPLTAQRFRHNGRIRVGYFSADFRNHPVAQLIAELFELHDRDSFELFGFSYGIRSDDEMRRRISSSFREFFDVNDLSDKQASELARSNGIDIAVDLTGYTQSFRTSMFAHRCAPVQVNYLGYPGTLGSAYMDYIIADHTVIQPGSESYFSEKIVYLPHCYQVNDRRRIISEAPISRSEFGLPENGFVYCCFNNCWKILPEVLDIWVSLLKKVDGSVLWLLEDNTTSVTALRNEAGARGINPDRLVFAKRVPLDRHISRHRCADLFLDTFPYNAHTTASDALWAGLPVLTLMGRSFPSRVAASLLTAIGLPELICDCRDDYETKALNLARNPEQLSMLRERLAENRCTYPLFDTPLFTRGLEAAYKEMVGRSQEGLAPSHIDVAFTGLATSTDL